MMPTIALFSALRRFSNDCFCGRTHHTLPSQLHNTRQRGPSAFSDTKYSEGFHWWSCESWCAGLMNWLTKSVTIFFSLYLLYRCFSAPSERCSPYFLSSTTCSVDSRSLSLFSFCLFSMESIWRIDIIALHTVIISYHQHEKYMHANTDLIWKSSGHLRYFRRYWCHAPLLCVSFSSQPICFLLFFAYLFIFTCPISDTHRAPALACWFCPLIFAKAVFAANNAAYNATCPISDTCRAPALAYWFCPLIFAKVVFASNNAADNATFHWGFHCWM